MELKIVKTIGKIWKTSKKTAVKYAPQIMACAGAGCFIAATYCAIKETPEAMAKLEEKKKLDPEMTKFQKIAVMAPAYKRTACLTVAGIGFTAGAWKIEADRMAELAGIAATALSRNRDLEDAAKEIVGEEKAKEIHDKAIEKDICPFEEDENNDPNLNIPNEYQVVPCKLSTTGQTFYKSRKGLVDAMEDNIADMKRNGYLHVETFAGNLGCGDLDLDAGWAVERTDGFGYDEDAIRDELEYDIEPWEDDYHRLGWYLAMRNSPYNINGHSY